MVAITDFDRVGEEVLLSRADRLAGAALPGTVALQLRDRVRSARVLLKLGARLLEVCERHGQNMMVNDRLDLAALLGVRGVHLGEGSVETTDARRFLGDSYVYRACHDVNQLGALGAFAPPGASRADALLLSPVLEARKGNAALGLEALSAARTRLERERSACRLYALGGVDATNARACLAAGAHGVAAIGATFDVEDALPLLEALGIARG